MTSFLTRLFRYQASEGRRPLEDFLSEALADFINRAPKPAANDFFAKCFVPAELHSLWRLLTRLESFSVRTQVRLESGKRIDLLAEVGNRPLVVIECKIGAALQMHKLPPVPSDVSEELILDGTDTKPFDVTYVNQLQTYGKWLASETEALEDWPGVITLITHAQTAPLDFVQSNLERYYAVPHLVRWRNIHAEIRRLAGPNTTDPEQPAWRFVGRELCTFLEELNMDSADLSSFDIASLNVAKSSTRRMGAVFSEIGVELLRRYPDQLVHRRQGNELNGEHNFFWGWLYIKGGEKKYIACGVKFAPENNENFPAVPPLPKLDHAFVAVGSDGTNFDIKPDNLPPGWHSVEWCILKPYPLQEQRANERFPEFLVRLIETEWETMNALLHASER